jgi:asparagine synthase (glutamine-hydrolysing)
MCGICGTAGFSDGTLLRRMCDVIHHRGPDDSGMFIDKGIGLGHRRLSIIDLKSGHQPIHNEDESIWIVFNGEIYNYLTLKEELEKRGHRFYTSSDTEVIVHAYEEFGEKCVEKFHGMFAFAIWDENRKKLFLARDRLGKKPMYYTLLDGTLLFGSEIKSILQYSEVIRKVDIQALHHFLTFSYIPGPRTMFEGIKKLPAGHTLSYENQKVNIVKYWEFSMNENFPNGEEYYIDNLKKILTDAIRIRLMSEVPLGAFLSGGLDSSTVVAIMSGLLEEPVKTITASFEEGGGYDETKYARIVADHFGTDHHEVVLKSKDIEILPEIIWHFDEPILDASAIPEYMIAEKAKQYVTVVMVGEGSDELFMGYAQHRLLPKIYKYQSPFPGFIKRNLAPGIAGFLAGAIPFRKTKRYLSFAANLGMTLGDQKGMYRAMIERFTENEKGRLCAVNPKSPEDALLPHFKEENFLKNMLSFEIKVNLPDNYLMNVDKMTMAHAIEARVPFLDHRLVEFAGTIPADLKLRGSDEKYILKKMMTGILPDTIIKRKKHPFVVPIVRWFEDDLRGLTDELLSEKNIKNQGYFNYDYVKKVLSKNNPDYNQPLALMYFELWHKIFIESDNVYNPNLKIYNM